MRLFVAVDLTNEVRQRIAEYIAQMVKQLPEAAGTKWVRDESLHLTLKFIGQSNRLDEIQAALGKIRSPSFAVSIRDVGFFTPGSPRIFWAGIHAPEELPRLASQVEHGLIPLGIPQEREGYHPHITLARSGSGRPHGAKGDRNKPWLLGLQQAIGAKPEFSHPDFGTITPQEFFLYRSETLPEGARYTKLASFPLRS